MTLRVRSTVLALAAAFFAIAASDAISQITPSGDVNSADPQRGQGQDAGVDADAGKDVGEDVEDGGKAETPIPEVKPAPPKLRGWAQELERAGTRLVYYRETPGGTWSESPGQIAITYSKVAWRKEYETSLDKLLGDTDAGDPSPSAPKIQLWRLGKDLWTTLDARLPMTLGDTQIAPGYYYLALELDRTTKPRFHLCLLDPTEVTEQRREAWHLNKGDNPIAIRVPLTHARLDKDFAKKELGIVFLVDTEDPTHAELRISFGEHTASTQVVVDVTADGK